MYDFKLEVLIKPKLKNSYIQVLKDKSVLVKTPFSTEHFVHDFVSKHLSWITQEIKKLDALTHYEIVLHDKEYVLDRLSYFSQEMDLEYEKVKFRKMKSRWGSCSSKKSITLNTHLLNLPSDLVDYVIVHELAHLEYMNHSKQFHALVRSYLPDEKELRKKFKTLRVA